MGSIEENLRDLIFCIAEYDRIPSISDSLNTRDLLEQVAMGDIQGIPSNIRIVLSGQRVSNSSLSISKNMPIITIASTGLSISVSLKRILLVLPGVSLISVRV